MKQGKTYGNAWLYKALIWLLRHVNIRILYVFQKVCVIPFTLLSKGYKITYRYYHDKCGQGQRQALLSSYRNNSLFGQTVVDKFAMYAGHHFVVRYNGEEQYREMTRKPQALMQLSAHIGCSEILGYSYNNSKPCNVLVYGGENPAMMEYRKQAFGNKDIRMIPVATEGRHSEEIISALDRGEIVCAFADRFMNEKKYLVSKIHGHEVKLARGPFSMAVTRGLDVVMANAMKEPDGSYTAFFTPLHYDRTLTPKAQRQQLADAYCTEIERLLTLYPTQWFNYSDIWLKGQNDK